MKNKAALIIVIFSLIGFTSIAQSNFKAELRKANPVDAKSTISNEEKLKIHHEYLAKALSNKNSTEQFYGYLYLWSDYLREHDYEAATLQLFSADSIAQQSGNLSWQAAVLGKRGILDFELNDPHSALKNYLIVLDYCTKKKDSTCIAETLKEIALVYHRLKKYDSAKYYFELAIPLIRKYTDSFSLYAYYSNYSNLMIDMGDYNSGKQYLDSAMAIIMNGSDSLNQSLSKNNLASLLIKMGEYDKAFKVLEECISINKRHGWYEQLSFNYANLSSIFSKKGDYRAAYQYLQNYHSINDSIKGAELQIKMVNLNASYQAQKKEIALNKSKLALAEKHRSLIKRNFFILILSIVAIVVLIVWRLQVRKKQNEITLHKENLQQLTNMLLQKNTMLSELEEKLSNRESDKIQTAETNDFESTLYNQHILTHDDWTAFKIRFEKAYPGYLLKLRVKYLTLTAAEERLFLFIKLKLKTKEIASILGISVDSVKKTRNRLRKRLELAEEIDLDAFVLSF